MINKETPVYPGSEKPSIVEVSTIESAGFSEKQISLYTHTGTHIDAPAHVLRGGATLDKFPAAHFIGRGMIIDVLGEGEIGLDLLKKSEEDIKNSEYIIFYSGWDKNWGKKEYFSGFPVLTEEAAHWLEKYHLKGIGIDAISVDSVENENLPIHKILLKNQILIVENLTGVDRIENKNFVFSCIPVNIDNSDGFPVRALAIEKY